MRRFAPIRTADPDLGRVQDEIARALNPLAAALELGVYAPGAAPAASEALRGRLIVVGSAGTKDHFQVCLRNSDGSYGWVDCAVAPT